MENDFYYRYKTYSKSQIFEILINKGDYQTDAINAATIVLKENDWESELNEIVNKQEQDYENEIIEKAEYYNKVVEYQKDNYYFSIRISDVPRFEAALVKENIDFYREDKYIGVQLDSYPTEKYYFKENDVNKVDKICIRLNLITRPYSDVKPFLKFEMKVILIAIFIAIIFFLIFIK